MKYLVDAQLPRRLALRLREAGFDAIYALVLPKGNRTLDTEINTISITELRIVVTKDSDFVDNFILHKRPRKLLLISTGNISNRELEGLFLANLPAITSGFSNFDFIEINRTSIIFRT